MIAVKKWCFLDFCWANNKFGAAASPAPSNVALWLDVLVVAVLNFFLFSSRHVTKLLHIV